MLHNEGTMDDPESVLELWHSVEEQERALKLRASPPRPPLPPRILISAGFLVLARL